MMTNNSNGECANIIKELKLFEAILPIFVSAFRYGPGGDLTAFTHGTLASTRVELIRVSSLLLSQDRLRLKVLSDRVRELLKDFEALIVPHIAAEQPGFISTESDTVSALFIRLLTK